MSQYIEFTVPEGLDLSGMEDDEEKEVLAVLRKKSDDTACIISVEGIEIAPGKKSKKEPEDYEEEDGYAKYASRAKRSLM